jgi:hypothetical protein
MYRRRGAREQLQRLTSIEHGWVLSDKDLELAKKNTWRSSAPISTIESLVANGMDLDRAKRTHDRPDNRIFRGMSQTLILYLWLSQRIVLACPLVMTKDRSEVLQGTLDLMVLKTLDAWVHCTDMDSRGALSNSVRNCCG